MMLMIIRMKRINILLYTILIGLVLSSCKGDSIILPEDVIIEPLPEPGEITGETLIYNSNLVDDSYVLVNEVTNGRVYLISKEKGEIKYEWDLPSGLGNDAELLPSGKLLVSLEAENTSPTLTIGGWGGRVQIINPDKSINWDFTYSSDKYLGHHDVELLPNGNILMMVWEIMNKSEAKQAGYIDIESIDQLIIESLIEVNPANNSIVWQWRSKDHLVQDFDENRNNFGNVSQNPQLINLNHAPRSNGDLMHANGIDYDAVNDIIYLSVNFYNEVWVIDHSTSKEEAVTNSGGNFNKGGNLIYRFGNPAAYGNNNGNQLFFNNHFPNILENNGIGSNRNVLIYMNGNVEKQSKIIEIRVPHPFNLLPDINNDPEIIWEFTNTELYSPILGGAVRLPNGNTLITEPGFGFWEITNEKEIVWKFKNDVLNWRGYTYAKDDTAIINLGL